MRIQAYILTCPQRSAILAETLASYAQTDMHEPPKIVCDERPLPNPKASQTANARRLLEQAKTDAWHYMLFLEDDVILNRHIRHNILTWDALPNVRVASLYCGFPVSAARAETLGGSQGILIERNSLQAILDAWDGFTTEMQDLRIYRTIGGRIPIHVPSLVQHRGEPSTWNGPKHESPTFSLDWRRY